MNRRDLFKSIPALAFQPAAQNLVAAQSNGRARLRSGLVAYSFREALSKHRMNYEDLLRLAADLNIDGLDLTVYWFPDTSDAFLLPLRRLAYKLAVDLYSLAIHSNMCQPTPDLQRREVDNVRKWVDIAQKVGAGHVRVFGGSVPAGATEDQAATWVIEILKRSAEYAASKGIILGLEDDGGITERADRVVQIVRQVDSPWVGINLDTGNFSSDPYNQIEKCMPYAVNVHFKSEVQLDGKSQAADWDRILGMFAKAGYRGHIALEYEAPEDPATAVPRLIRKLRPLLEKYSYS